MFDENNAESSTAQPAETPSDKAVGSRDFAAFEKIENARAAGKPITEASAPSKESSEIAAASETVETKPQEKKPGAKERIQELLDQRVALENENVRLKTELDKKPGDKKADPPPAVEKPGARGQTPGASAPVEPKLEDFATFAEYQAADRAYTREMVKFETREALAADRAEQQVAAANKVIETGVKLSLTVGREKYADFDKVALNSNTPISKAADGFILSADDAIRADILYRLGENDGAEGKRINALPAYKQLRALMTIESEFTEAGTKPPPVKKHTTAPPPATDLAARNVGPADEAEAAVAAKDFVRYERVMNARALQKG
jgi:hypothetical protein